MLNFLIFLLFNKVNKIVFVTKIAVNMEQIIPKDNVIAKPFTGPEPKIYKLPADIRVVRLESNIVLKALS